MAVRDRTLLSRRGTFLSPEWIRVSRHCASNFAGTQPSIVTLSFPGHAMPHRHRSTRLCLEQLEDRVVPAGNVTVTLLGTQIIVTGDAAANGLEISPDTPANQFIFRGLDGTKINNSTTPLTVNVPLGLARLTI